MRVRSRRGTRATLVRRRGRVRADRRPPGAGAAAGPGGGPGRIRRNLRVGGGHTIAQDEQSSIIFGMPRAAIELDAAEMILPLEEIGPQIMKWVSEQHSSYNH